MDDLHEKTGLDAAQDRLAKDAFDRGVACMEIGEYDQAIEAFTEAIRFCSGSVRAHFARAHAYAEKGDHDRAIVDCGIVIGLDSEHFRFIRRKRRVSISIASTGASSLFHNMAGIKVLRRNFCAPCAHVCSMGPRPVGGDNTGQGPMLLGLRPQAALGPEITRHSPALRGGLRAAFPHRPPQQRRGTRTPLRQDVYIAHPGLGSAGFQVTLRFRRMNHIEPTAFAL